MPGVSIGDNVVIGANSLIHQNLPSNCLAAGAPAKVLKEDFPPPLDEEKRKEILADIFRDFKEHLAYHGYEVEQEFVEGGWALRVGGDRGQHHEMLYLERAQGPAVGRHTQLLVQDEEGVEISRGGVDHAMMIDLRAKKRWGTSKLGEEFVSFISRYGVRFDRLD